MNKWDASRNIQRESVYKKMTFRVRERLLQSLATSTFAKGEVNFTTKRASNIIKRFVVKVEIADSSEVDADVILGEIEKNHGLIVKSGKDAWIFSHLTLQEYFVASFLAQSPLTTKKNMIRNYFSDPRWREVIILMCSLLSDCDELILEMMEDLAERGVSPAPMNRLRAKGLRTSYIDDADPEDLINRGIGAARNTASERRSSHLTLVHDLTKGHIGWDPVELKNIRQAIGDKVSSITYELDDSEIAQFWLSQLGEFFSGALERNSKKQSVVLPDPTRRKSLNEFYKMFLLEVRLSGIRTLGSTLTPAPPDHAVEDSLGTHGTSGDQSETLPADDSVREVYVPSVKSSLPSVPSPISARTLKSGRWRLAGGGPDGIEADFSSFVVQCKSLQGIRKLTGMSFMYISDGNADDVRTRLIEKGLPLLKVFLQRGIHANVILRNSGEAIDLIEQMARGMLGKVVNDVVLFHKERATENTEIFAKFVAAETLSEIVSSPIVVSPEIRSAAIEMLASMAVELPDPPSTPVMSGRKFGYGQMRS